MQLVKARVGERTDSDLTVVEQGAEEVAKELGFFILGP